MKRATRVILGLIAMTAVLVRSAGAGGAGIGAQSMGGAAKDNTSRAKWAAPAPDWTVAWYSGGNEADQLSEDHHFVAEEAKLAFEGGSWDIGGRTYVGYSRLYGPGQYGSSSYTSGYGFSSSRYLDNGHGGRDLVPIIDLTVNADGFLGPPVAGKKPRWWSGSFAKDPIIFRQPDFLDVPPVTDMFFSIELRSVHTSGGRVELHSWYETATSTTELVTLTLDPTGVAVSGVDPSVSFVLRDSMGQAPPQDTDPRIDANQLRIALLGQMVGDSLGTPFIFYAVLQNTTVPTIPFDASPLRTESALSGDALAKFHIDLAAYSGAGAGSRVVMPFSNVAIPPDPVSYVIVPDRAPIVDLAFDPSGPFVDDDVALYEHSPAGWMLRTIWNWNAGTARSFVPTPGVERYALVGCGNQYPIPFHVTFPLNVHPPTPMIPATMPDFALGAVDHQQNPFSPMPGIPFGSAPPIFVNPGLGTLTVPRLLGEDHWQYLPIQYNFQPDPTRPWLYLGNNPAFGLAQPTFLTLHLDGLFDAFGNPIANLPIEVDLLQGPNQQFLMGNAHYDPNGKVVFPPVNLGTLLPQPFTIIIGVPGGPVPQGAMQRVTTSGLRAASTLGAASTQILPGYFSMNGVVVSNGITTVTGVGDTPVPGAPTTLTLEAIAPNPCRDRAQLAFSTVRSERVRVGVYDLAGREVRALLDQTLAAGRHEVTWDGRGRAQERVNPGVYFVRVRQGADEAMRKITMVR
jgi:hypothetical protein